MPGQVGRGRLDNGSFTWLLPEGTYSGDVRVTPGWVLVGTINFSVTAGETTDIGTVDFQIGTLGGTVYWNGGPVDPAWLAMYTSGNRVAIRPDSSSTVVATGAVATDGTYSVANLPVGGYDPSVYFEYYGYAPGLLGIGPLTQVTAGGTSIVDIDTTATAGLAVGQITVNGAPADGQVTLYVSGQVGRGRLDNGSFTWLLPEGTYSGDVYVNPGNVLLGTINFSVTAGETTDIETGDTPSGTNVIVSLLGGLSSVAGIQLTFDTVADAGSTTASVSGGGPTPPSALLTVGRYYDISTTAAYSGNVETCIRYDEAQVIGPESPLQLMRHNGSTWDDITTSLDTDADVICGTSTALGTFVVMEPLDGDGDGVDIPTDNCPKIANADQTDTDSDGIGDVCDADDDGDGFTDDDETGSAGTPPGNTIGSDPLDSNSTPEVCDGADNDLNEGIDEGYTDTDTDGEADCVDDDDDGDGVLDGPDNCPLVANTPQIDTDGDGQGDACDPDDDNDGFTDTAETGSAGNPPGNTIGSDPLDENSVPEVCDGADNDLNEGVDEGYLDTNADGEADCVDDDDDGDGLLDGSDNCPLDYNPDQTDTDGDGLGDACDPNTPSGSNVDVPLLGGLDTTGGLELTFDTVTADGDTTATTTTTGPEPPSNYRLVGDYYDISTTATFSGPVTVCVVYDETDVLASEELLELRHHDGVSLIDITTTLDSDTNVICGESTSFSLFAVLEPVDLSVGGITGEVKWNDSPVDPAWLNGGRVDLAPLFGTSAIATDGTYFITDIAAQTYTPELIVRGAVLATGPSKQVRTGRTSVSNINTTNVAGKVTATSLTMNGVLVNGNLGSLGPIVDGSFTFLLPPDTYSEPVTNDQGMIGTLNFSVTVGDLTVVPPVGFPGGYVTAIITTNGTTLVNGTLGNLGPIVNGYFTALLSPRSYSEQVMIGSSVAGAVAFDLADGETKDLGTIDLSVGTFEGTVTWDGSPVDPSWLNGATVNLQPANGSATVGAGGAYSIANVEATTYTPALSSGTGVTGAGLAADVPRDGIGTSDIDLTDDAGFLTAFIKANGIPVNGSLDGYGTITNGSLELLLPPGQYTDVPVIIGGSTAGHLTFSISPGVPTPLGAVVLAPGAIGGTVFWNSETVDPLWLNGATISLQPAFGSTSLQSGGSYSIANVEAGTYTPDLSARSEVLGSGAATEILPGGASTADIDITNVVGRISGFITINGEYRDAYIGELGPVTSGAFLLMLRPGIYSEPVYAGSSIAGIFTFCVIAGQDTNQYTLRDTDADCDGVPNASDLCPNAADPSNGDNDGDGVPGVQPPPNDGWGGDACDTDDDNDGLGDTVEPPCGSNPLDGLSIPERLNGPYAGVDEDGDTVVDEALPPGSDSFDCDGDGFTGSVEAYVFSAADTSDDQRGCPPGWPPDFDDSQGVDIFDALFFAPPVFFSIAPGPPFQARFDLNRSGGIDIFDVLTMAPPIFFSTCTP